MRRIVCDTPKVYCKFWGGKGGEEGGGSPVGISRGVTCGVLPLE